MITKEEKKLMKIEYDEKGFHKTILDPSEVGLFLYKEFLHQGKRQGLYKKFIMWITGKMASRYNGRPVSCSLFIKKRKESNDKKPRFQFFLSFKYYSYSYADWKEIRLGVTATHAVWLRRFAVFNFPM